MIGIDYRELVVSCQLSVVSCQLSVVILLVPPHLPCSPAPLLPHPLIPTPMLFNQDPIILHGPLGQTKPIPAIDAPGWIAQGWSLEPIPILQAIEEVQALPPKRKKLLSETKPNDGDTVSEI